MVLVLAMIASAFEVVTNAVKAERRQIQTWRLQHGTTATKTADNNNNYATITAKSSQREHLSVRTHNCW